MITKKKVDIYKYFKGDIDGWVRTGSKQQKEEMNDNDWAVIDSYIQDIALVKKGFVSKEYMNSLTSRLKVECESEETIELLRKLADK